MVAMKIRRATLDDARDILTWRNDAAAVAASKSQKAIDEAEHMRWFQGAVQSPDHLILIAEADGRKLGMVRFDRRPDHWLASINMSPEVRGKGYGRAALSAAIDILYAEAGPDRIVAEIKSDNVRSLRLFMSLGFFRQGEQAGFQSFVIG
jgi:RimJ/RimL family protein N-acetyltransferase